MKKFFLLSAVILILCLSQKSFAQNISDSNYRDYSYRGYSLDFSLVKLVLDSKIQISEILKSKIDVILDDSIEFYSNRYSHRDAHFYSMKTLENFTFYWGKNKLDKSWSNFRDVVALKKQDEFYVRYEIENEYILKEPPPNPKLVVMFYCSKEGNGGFFKLDENGSFIFKTDSSNTTFSPMNVTEIILFKKRLIDLFIAINAVCKK